MKKLYGFKKKYYLIIITLLLVGFSEKADAFQRGIRVNNDNKVKYIGVNDQFPLIEFSGDWILFADDDRSIKKMSPDSYLKFTRVTFGVKRTIHVKSGSDGHLAYEFFIGKKKVNFKPEGEKWLKENLIEVIRSTSLGSEQRVDRIYKKSGVSGVLEEIDQIDNDFTKEAYFEHLFNKDQISQEEFVTILNAVREQIKSDNELSKLYRKFPQKHIMSRRIGPVYFEAIRDMKEDYELSELMKNINKMNLDQENITRLVESTEAIKADYEKSRVLNEIMKKHSLDQKNLEEIIIRSEKIASERELTDVLENMIKLQTINEQNVIRILEISNKFSSDYEHARVLGSVIAKLDLKDKILKNILVNVNAMKVDSESSMILKELIKNPDMEENELIEVIKGGKDINSDYELANFLSFVINNHEISIPLLKQIIETADHIESPDEYTAILSKLISETRYLPGSLKPLLEATDRIDSAYDILHVLNTVINEYELTDEIIKDITETAENIDSEHDYYEIIGDLFNRSTINSKNIKYFFDSFDNLTEDYTISMSLMILLNKNYNYSYEDIKSITQLAQNLESSHEYSYILYQLVNNTVLNEKNTLVILEACGPIKSEGELINLLVAIGVKMPKNNPVLIKAYQKAAENLPSVADYNKALNAIKK